MNTYNDLFEFVTGQLGLGWYDSDMDNEEVRKRFEERCSRVVYKSTECGAWLAFVMEPKHVRELTTWTASIEFDGKDVKAKEVRLNGAAVPLDDLPEEVAQYLGLGLTKPRGPVLCMDKYEFLSMFSAGVPAPTDDGDGEGHRWYDVTKDSAALSMSVFVPKPRPHPGVKHGIHGVRIGSIVEGSDAEINEPDLMFPFTEHQWDEAVRHVEDVVTEVWNRTHGCETCFKLTLAESGHQGSYEDHVGEVEVRADCPDCNGKGAVI